MALERVSRQPATRIGCRASSDTRRLDRTPSDTKQPPREVRSETKTLRGEEDQLTYGLLETSDGLTQHVQGVLLPRTRDRDRASHHVRLHEGADGVRQEGVAALQELAHADGGDEFTPHLAGARGGPVPYTRKNLLRAWPTLGDLGQLPHHGRLGERHDEPRRPSARPGWWPRARQGRRHLRLRAAVAGLRRRAGSAWGNGRLLEQLLPVHALLEVQGCRCDKYFQLLHVNLTLQLRPRLQAATATTSALVERKRNISDNSVGHPLTLSSLGNWWNLRPLWRSDEGVTVEHGAAGVDHPVKRPPDGRSRPDTDGPPARSPAPPDPARPHAGPP
ncbi:unnamed protein product [Danaus chrysippus]|uniref:(African queen) hypothetical protein n=1 Tax=Danaus chrysippus TaxID=151541 RepID=A0A8J2W0C8_9NEOP|nr:unnamed protein product [Danaus chrysippus]